MLILPHPPNCASPLSLPAQNARLRYYLAYIISHCTTLQERLATNPQFAPIVATIQKILPPLHNIIKSLSILPKSISLAQHQQQFTQYYDILLKCAYNLCLIYSNIKYHDNCIDICEVVIYLYQYHCSNVQYSPNIDDYNKKIVSLLQILTQSVSQKLAAIRTPSLHQTLSYTTRTGPSKTLQHLQELHPYSSPLLQPHTLLVSYTYYLFKLFNLYHIFSTAQYTSTTRHWCTIQQFIIFNEIVILFTKVTLLYKEVAALPQFLKISHYFDTYIPTNSNTIQIIHDPDHSLDPPDSDDTSAIDIIKYRCFYNTTPLDALCHIIPSINPFIGSYLSQILAQSCGNIPHIDPSCPELYTTTSQLAHITLILAQLALLTHTDYITILTSSSTTTPQQCAKYNNINLFYKLSQIDPPNEQDTAPFLLFLQQNVYNSPNTYHYLATLPAIYLDSLLLTIFPSMIQCTPTTLFLSNGDDNILTPVSFMLFIFVVYNYWVNYVTVRQYYTSKGSDFPCVESVTTILNLNDVFDPYCHHQRVSPLAPEETPVVSSKPTHRRKKMIIFEEQEQEEQLDHCKIILTLNDNIYIITNRIISLGSLHSANNENYLQFIHTTNSIYFNYLAHLMMIIFSHLLTTHNWRNIDLTIEDTVDLYQFILTAYHYIITYLPPISSKLLKYHYNINYVLNYSTDVNVTHFSLSEAIYTIYTYLKHYSHTPLFLIQNNKEQIFLHPQADSQQQHQYLPLTHNPLQYTLWSWLSVVTAYYTHSLSSLSTAIDTPNIHTVIHSTVQELIITYSLLLQLSTSNAANAVKDPSVGSKKTLHACYIDLVLLHTQSSIAYTLITNNVFNSMYYNKSSPANSEINPDSTLSILNLTPKSPLYTKISTHFFNISYAYNFNAIVVNLKQIITIIRDIVNMYSNNPKETLIFQYLPENCNALYSQSYTQPHSSYFTTSLHHQKSDAIVLRSSVDHDDDRVNAALDIGNNIFYIESSLKRSFFRDIFDSINHPTKIAIDNTGYQENDQDALFSDNEDNVQIIPLCEGVEYPCTIVSSICYTTLLMLYEGMNKNLVSLNMTLPGTHLNTIHTALYQNYTHFNYNFIIFKFVPLLTHSFQLLSSIYLNNNDLLLSLHYLQHNILTSKRLGCYLGYLESLCSTNVLLLLQETHHNPAFSSSSVFAHHDQRCNILFNHVIRIIYDYYVLLGLKTPQMDLFHDFYQSYDEFDVASENNPTHVHCIYFYSVEQLLYYILPLLRIMNKRTSDTTISRQNYLLLLSLCIIIRPLLPFYTISISQQYSSSAQNYPELPQFLTHEQLEQTYAAIRNSLSPVDRTQPPHIGFNYYDIQNMNMGRNENASKPKAKGRPKKTIKNAPLENNEVINIPVVYIDTMEDFTEYILSITSGFVSPPTRNIMIEQSLSIKRSIDSFYKVNSGTSDILPPSLHSSTTLPAKKSITIVLVQLFIKFLSQPTHTNYNNILSLFAQYHSKLEMDTANNSNYDDIETIRMRELSLTSPSSIMTNTVLLFRKLSSLTASFLPIFHTLLFKNQKTKGDENDFDSSNASALSSYQTIINLLSVTLHMLSTNQSYRILRDTYFMPHNQDEKQILTESVTMGLGNHIFDDLAQLIPLHTFLRSNKDLSNVHAPTLPSLFEVLPYWLQVLIFSYHYDAIHNFKYKFTHSSLNNFVVVYHNIAPTIAFSFFQPLSALPTSPSVHFSRASTLSIPHFPVFTLSYPVQKNDSVSTPLSTEIVNIFSQLTLHFALLQQSISRHHQSLQFVNQNYVTDVLQLHHDEVAAKTKSKSKGKAASHTHNFEALSAKIYDILQQLWWLYTYRLEFAMLSYQIYYEQHIFGPFSGLLRPFLTTTPQGPEISKLIEKFSKYFLMFKDLADNLNTQYHQQQQVLLLTATINTMIFSPLYSINNANTTKVNYSSSLFSDTNSTNEDNINDESNHQFYPSNGLYGQIQALMYICGIISTPYITLTHAFNIITLIHTVSLKNEDYHIIYPINPYDFNHFNVLYTSQTHKFVTHSDENEHVDKDVKKPTRSRGRVVGKTTKVVSEHPSNSIIHSIHQYKASLHAELVFLSHYFHNHYIDDQDDKNDASSNSINELTFDYLSNNQYILNYQSNNPSSDDPNYKIKSSADFISAFDLLVNKAAIQQLQTGNQQHKLMTIDKFYIILIKFKKLFTSIQQLLTSPTDTHSFTTTNPLTLLCHKEWIMLSVETLPVYQSTLFLNIPNLCVNFDLLFNNDNNRKNSSNDEYTQRENILSLFKIRPLDYDDNGDDDDNDDDDDGDDDDNDVVDENDHNDNYFGERQLQTSLSSFQPIGITSHIQDFYNGLYNASSIISLFDILTIPPLKTKKKGGKTSVDANAEDTPSSSHSSIFMNIINVKLRSNVPQTPPQRITRVVSLHHLYMNYYKLATTILNDKHHCELLSSSPHVNAHHSIPLLVDNHSNKHYDTFFQIDPSSDLPKTQLKMKDILSMMSLFHDDGSIDGVYDKSVITIGKPYDITELLHNFRANSMYVYAGHNNGEQFYSFYDIISSSSLTTTRTNLHSIKTTIAWLFGCSSSKILTTALPPIHNSVFAPDQRTRNNFSIHYSTNQLEPFGSVLSYILLNIPCIVGNLWAILDKDLDKQTIIIFDNIFNLKKSKKKYPSIILDNFIDGSDSSNHCCDISALINYSRQQCVLPYLNGAAMVIYGAHMRTEIDTTKS